MKILICLLIGYCLGMLSPSAFFSKIKHKNMKQAGTGNLGASNAVIVLGRKFGIVIMVLDILKALAAAHFAAYLFPDMSTAGYWAGFGAILGHVYPFYLHFQGGKGLACFGGMACFYSPWLLAFYLTIGIALTLLANRSVFLVVFAAVTFPIILILCTGDWACFGIVSLTSALMLWIHRKNFGRVERGEEAPMRKLAKATLSGKKVTMKMDQEESPPES